MDEEKQSRGPVVVNNRDIPLLSEVLDIMQDISALERRREWQRDRMYNITSHLTGMPRGGGGSTGTLFENVFSELSTLDESHEEKVHQYVRELKRAEKIINSISSRTMRTFVTMKYLLDIPNAAIMRDLNMTEWGFNRARRAVEDAEDMAHVIWRERYIVDESKPK